MSWMGARWSDCIFYIKMIEIGQKVVRTQVFYFRITSTPLRVLDSTLFRRASRVGSLIITDSYELLFF